jgi:hypothetical protein
MFLISSHSGFNYVIGYDYLSLILICYKVDHAVVCQKLFMHFIKYLSNFRMFQVQVVD